MLSEENPHGNKGWITAVVFLVTALLLIAGNPGLCCAADEQSADRLWSVNIGPNAKNWGYVGITRDYPVNDHFSTFVTGGLGTILIGCGTAWYTNGFHDNSAVFSATIGILGWHADAAYQWNVAEHGFLTAGVSYGLYFIQYQGFLPILSYEYRF